MAAMLNSGDSSRGPPRPTEARGNAQEPGRRQATMDDAKAVNSKKGSKASRKAKNAARRAKRDMQVEEAKHASGIATPAPEEVARASMLNPKFKMRPLGVAYPALGLFVKLMSFCVDKKNAMGELLVSFSKARTAVYELEFFVRVDLESNDAQHQCAFDEAKVFMEKLSQDCADQMKKKVLRKFHEDKRNTRFKKNLAVQQCWRECKMFATGTDSAQDLLHSLGDIFNDSDGGTALFDFFVRGEFGAKKGAHITAADLRRPNRATKKKKTTADDDTQQQKMAQMYGAAPGPVDQVHQSLSKGSAQPNQLSTSIHLEYEISFEHQHKGNVPGELRYKVELGFRVVGKTGPDSVEYQWMPAAENIEVRHSPFRFSADWMNTMSRDTVTYIRLQATTATVGNSEWSEPTRLQTRSEWDEEQRRAKWSRKIVAFVGHYNAQRGLNHLQKPGFDFKEYFFTPQSRFALVKHAGIHYKQTDRGYEQLLGDFHFGLADWSRDPALIDQMPSGKSLKACIEDSTAMLSQLGWVEGKRGPLHALQKLQSMHTRLQSCAKVHRRNMPAGQQLAGTDFNVKDSDTALVDEDTPALVRSSSRTSANSEDGLEYAERIASHHSRPAAAASQMKAKAKALRKAKAKVREQKKMKVSKHLNVIETPLMNRYTKVLSKMNRQIDRLLPIAATLRNEERMTKWTQGKVQSQFSHEAMEGFLSYLTGDSCTCVSIFALTRLRDALDSLLVRLYVTLDNERTQNIGQLSVELEGLILASTNYAMFTDEEIDTIYELEEMTEKTHQTFANVRYPPAVESDIFQKYADSTRRRGAFSKFSQRSFDLMQKMMNEISRKGIQEMKVEQPLVYNSQGDLVAPDSLASNMQLQMKYAMKVLPKLMDMRQTMFGLLHNIRNHFAKARERRKSSEAQSKSTDAMDLFPKFLNRVKQRFGDKNWVVQDLLDLMLGFKSGKVSKRQVASHVQKLFRDHTDLMLEFNMFLPRALHNKSWNQQGNQQRNQLRNQLRNQQIPNGKSEQPKRRRRRKAKEEIPEEPVVIISPDLQRMVVEGVITQADAVSMMHPAYINQDTPTKPEQKKKSTLQSSALIGGTSNIGQRKARHAQLAKPAKHALPSRNRAHKPANEPTNTTRNILANYPAHQTTQTPAKKPATRVPITKKRLEPVQRAQTESSMSPPHVAQGDDYQAPNVNLAFLDDFGPNDAIAPNTEQKSAWSNETIRSDDKTEFVDANASHHHPLKTDAKIPDLDLTSWLNTVDPKFGNLYAGLLIEEGVETVGDLGLLLDDLNDLKEAGVTKLVHRKKILKAYQKNQLGAVPGAVATPTTKSVDGMDYDVDQVLGSGAGGTLVFRGTFMGRAVAVKRVGRRQINVVKREMNAFNKGGADSHSNIVQFLGIVEDIEVSVLIMRGHPVLYCYCFVFLMRSLTLSFFCVNTVPLFGARALLCKSPRVLIGT
jgi:hypothetical protein